VNLLNQSGPSGEIPGIKRVILSGGKPSFQSLLDDVCERLQGTIQQGSLRRIQKLEKILDTLEEELDEIQALFQVACRAKTIQEE